MFFFIFYSGSEDSLQRDEETNARHFGAKRLIETDDRKLDADQLRSDIDVRDEVVQWRKGLRPEVRPSQKQLSLAVSVTPNRDRVNPAKEPFRVN
jgi:hypothetical protein